MDNLNITIASDQNTKIGRDLKQRIGNIVDSLAVAKQLIKVQDGGKVWLGSESVNVLQILNDLIQGGGCGDHCLTAHASLHG